uniref:AlNc14C282G10127 protein n=1 Tax=Albugo laibachii Nc14 TaxID=890382 RepID=F0WUY0_9STRA|nr:AlNc14C282G10127 [Albugo laibachii Nc14]|eukprot:CCA25216.1 AlNc14C282G10127 [Albugo laibachii Nc14]
MCTELGQGEPGGKMRVGEQHSCTRKETEKLTVTPEVFGYIGQLDAHFRSTVSAMEQQLELMTQQNALLRERLHLAESRQEVVGEEMRRKEECMEMSREEFLAVRVEADQMVRQERAYWTTDYQSGKETEINELLQYIEELQSTVQSRDEDIWKLRYVNREFKCLLRRIIPEDRTQAKGWQQPHKNKYIHLQIQHTRTESNQLKDSGIQARLHAFTEKQDFAGEENTLTTLAHCDQDDISFSTSDASTVTTDSPSGPYFQARADPPETPETPVRVKNGREESERTRLHVLNEHDVYEFTSHTNRLEVELAALREKLKACQESAGF